MTTMEPKSIQQHADLVDSGFFVLRTPMLPFDELMKWSDGLQSCAAVRRDVDSDDIGRKWQADVDGLRARLREFVDRPEIRQALFIASPSLEPSLDNWRRDPNSKKGLQTERSLVRYFSRMCARPTPFGLFAGHSTGRISIEAASRSDLHLEARSSYRLACRLDFDYLFALTTALHSDAAISESLLYWSNSSLRSIGNVWHYVESRLAGSNRSHHLVKLYCEPVLDSIIKCAQKGLSIQSLVEAASKLPGASECSLQEIRDYISDLIRNGVLVSSLSPLVTGEPALDDLIKQLANIPAAAQVLQGLCQARDSMAALDHKGLGTDPAEYRTIASGLKRLPAKFDLAKLFQVDMIKDAPRLMLSSQVVNELKAAIAVLCQISQPGELHDLQIFREAFVARYERAWVPLEMVLDEESGIGFGSTSGADSSPLLRNLGQVGKRTAPQAAAVGFHARLKRQCELLATQRAATEIVLDIADLPPVTTPRLPDALDLMVTLVAPSVDALTRGDFQVALKGVSGPSGARLLGRFCHADRELESCVRGHFSQEEGCDSDAAYAEIVHLPEGRIGNVLCRPVLRDYEIVYLGRSGAPLERQLPISDLLVTVEPSGRILLYSQRLQKRVIPRLTNAHGYFNPTLSSVYRFLSLLQNDGASLPSFSWGELAELSTLPRVRVGRIVLACAQWRLSRDEVNVVAEKDGQDRFLSMQELRNLRGLPRWVVLIESDNSLPVDLDNPLSVDAFIHVLKRAGQGTIAEMYPAPQELCVTGPEGRFCHELVVPFVRARSNGKEDTRRERLDASATVDAALKAVGVNIPRDTRTIPPGGDWLYMKIYGGSATLDEMLVSTLPSVLRRTSGMTQLSEWFFIRYTDPHLHLRLRFHGSPHCLLEEVLPLIHSALSPFVSSGRIWKVQLDTYEREIERYGGLEAMAISEQIFSVDSEAVVEILEALEGDDGIDMRWRIALLAIHRLFCDFGLDLPARRDESQRMRDAYEREFGIGQVQRKQLGDKFRRERNALKNMLGNLEDTPAFAILRQALERRSERLALLVQRLRTLAENRNLNAELVELVSVYNHLHVNRLLRMEQRTHELVLYDFLYRLYDAELSQQHSKTRASAAVSLSAAFPNLQARPS